MHGIISLVFGLDLSTSPDTLHSGISYVFGFGVLTARSQRRIYDAGTVCKRSLLTHIIKPPVYLMYSILLLGTIYYNLYGISYVLFCGPGLSSNCDIWIFDIKMRV